MPALRSREINRRTQAADSGGTDPGAFGRFVPSVSSKRRTRATIAKKKGWKDWQIRFFLQMLDHSVEEEAKQYLDEEKEVTTVEQAISGALDILAEAIADEADYRTAIRKTTMQKGSLVSTAKMQKRKRFTKIIMIFSTVLSKVSGYQTLAINRGEKEKF